MLNVQFFFQTLPQKNGKCVENKRIILQISLPSNVENKFPKFYTLLFLNLNSSIWLQTQAESEEYSLYIFQTEGADGSED